MVLAKENNFGGTADGLIDIECPMGETMDMLKGVDGTIQFAATDGSYGRMGLATKMLTVLKTTAIIQLSLPNIKDKGLTYDESRASMQMKDGVVTVDEFMLEDRAYAMDASGTVDYPADTMDITARVRMLEAVTDLLEVIPGIKDIVQKVKKNSGIRLHIGGAPFDPKIKTFAVEPAEEEAPAEEAQQTQEPTPPAEEKPKDKIRSLLFDAAESLFNKD
jgi:uncharacterized protein YhdP